VLIMLPGRAAQARPQLDSFVQYCVNELQLTVINPDLRGAGGYGRSFTALAHGDADTGAALDLGALLAWIGTQDDLQRDRIGLLGRGEGGTLALAGAGLYADRVRAAISIDGTAAPAQLAAIRQPVLLLRGFTDPPLDAASAEQLLWRLHGVGVVPWYMGPAAPAGRLDVLAEQSAAEQLIARFLQQFLAAP
jgi:pimeloyl-ACP methyl ester carboxylesterase